MKIIEVKDILTPSQLVAEINYKFISQLYIAL